MSRKLSWKWLCSRFVPRRTPAPVAMRPCLAALEQLEDRVLLSTALPIPLSSQSVSAVSAFLKIEDSFLSNQGGFVQTQKQLISNSGNKLSPAVVDYFLKIDGDMIFLPAGWPRPRPRRRQALLRQPDLRHSRSGPAVSSSTPCMVLHAVLC